MLPFKMSLSPYIFTKTLRLVIKVLRAKGIRVVAYMDNILLIVDTY